MALKKAPVTVLFALVKGGKFSLVCRQSRFMHWFYFVPGDARGLSVEAVEKGRVSEVSCALSSRTAGAKITFVYTAPEYRGLRLSKSLLIFALHRLKELGVNTVHLRVGSYPETEKDAVAIYASLGFVPAGGRVMVNASLQKTVLPRIYIKRDVLSFA